MATNQTFTDFQTPVPADWLNGVNALNGAKEVIAVVNSSGQSIPNNTATIVTNWTTITDKQASGAFNLTTGIFTCPVTGIYQMSATCCFSGAMPVGTTISLNIQAGAFSLCNPVVMIANATNTLNQVQGFVIANLTVGQFVEVYVFQNSGGAVPLYTNFLNNQFQIMRVG